MNLLWEVFSSNMAQTSLNVYQFKIALKGFKPQIWRRILVVQHYSFYDLHLAIQDAMGWRNCCLYQFELKNPNTGRKQLVSTFDDAEMESISGMRVKIAKYFLAPKDKVNYQYDFGDSWDHTVTLEKILPAGKGQQYPQVIGGKNACPPENCGGVCGYGELLEIITDPSHEEHKKRIDWLKEMEYMEDDLFDPKMFDPKAVNFRDLRNY